ncbi:glycosyltransferase [Rhizobium sp. G21]|uniref:glycosyltransferase family 2 protein n=1 Tax=Rhizobium sp. G21 TaxID=2758439 RepID=UPI0016043697|nr:glycosyltransferase [Rhizobium sp. G21]MBB1249027.1 glycosyltransferase [Rhizobium sp. G21]
MPDRRPRLSLCIPTRNRPACAQRTLVDLLGNPRRDVEIIFADNSDAALSLAAFAATVDDPRLTYLPPADRGLSMPANWTRAVAACRGDWIVVIGDDDFFDLDMVGCLDAIEARATDVDCIGWNRLSFAWPDSRRIPGNMALQLGNRAAETPRAQFFDRLFGWRGASHVPSSAYSIYHGAVRRDLVEKIARRYGDLFEHAVVDYEWSCKLAVDATRFLYVERPFSVAGVSAESNSAAAGDFTRSRANHRAMIAEHGAGEEASEWISGFPFGPHLGVAGCILGVQHWFKQKYGVDYGGWQENFVKALVRDCENGDGRDGFDQQVVACRSALAAFEDGRWLAEFRPCYRSRKQAQALTGLRGGTLYIDETVADTPAQALRFVRQIVEPFESLTFLIEPADRPSTTASFA